MSLNRRGSIKCVGAGGAGMAMGKALVPLMQPGWRMRRGASIGEHRHEKDEEVYVILRGHGTMRTDGTDQPVGPGDVCLTRASHSHNLANGMHEVMHFLVLAANI